MTTDELLAALRSNRAEAHEAMLSAVREIVAPLVQAIQEARLKIAALEATQEDLIDQAVRRDVRQKLTTRSTN